jgi:hypothetical protein
LVAFRDESCQCLVRFRAPLVGQCQEPVKSGRIKWRVAAAVSPKRCARRFGGWGSFAERMLERAITSLVSSVRARGK